MKKIISVLFSMTILLSVAIGVNANPLITVTVDGEAVVFDAQPEMVNERTMVPMRAIFEKLGAEVSWDQPTQTVTAVTEDKTVVATVGEMSMYVNGEEKVMDVAPYIKEERTYVPARFVSEALDCKVDWDQENYTVIIETLTDDADYLYAYNVIKDFLLEHGLPMDEPGQWMYIEEMEQLQLIMNYDQNLGYAEVGIVVPVKEGTDVVQIISASITGECMSSTNLTATVQDEVIDERLVIYYKDGEITIQDEEEKASVLDSMLKLADESWKVIDQVLQLIDTECSVSDFGVRLPDKMI